MWSWKSNVSRTFASCAASLVLAAFAVMLAAERSSGFARDREPTGASGDVRRNPPLKEENHLGATVSIRVTLEGITSYNDYLELKTALLKSEGVDKLVIESEAPSLISLSVRYAGEPKSLIDKLNGYFSKKYRIKEKGGGEISISRSGD